MSADIDERHCPQCGHEVLSWDITCPGCDHVPWDTPAGRRILRQRRRHHFWVTEGPWVILITLLGLAAVAGLWSLHRQAQIIRWTRIFRGTEPSSDVQATHVRKRAGFETNSNSTLASLEVTSFFAKERRFRQALESAEPGTQAYEDLTRDVEHWLNGAIPKFIQIAQTRQTPSLVRAANIEVLGVLFDEASSVASIAVRRRPEVIAALAPLEEERDETIRVTSAGVLWAMHADEALHPFKELAVDPSSFIRAMALVMLLEHRATQVPSLARPDPNSIHETFDWESSLLADDLPLAAEDRAAFLQETKLTTYGVGRPEVMEVFIKTPRALSWLIEQLQSRDTETAERVGLCLSLVADEVHGVDAQAWRRWADRLDKKKPIHLVVTLRPHKVYQVQRRHLQVLCPKLLQTRTARLATVGGYYDSHVRSQFAISLDGQMAASMGKGEPLRLWDIATGRAILEFQENGYRPEVLAISPNRRFILSTSSNGRGITWWDPTTGAEGGTYSSARSVSALAISPDSRFAAFGEKDGNVTLWDTTTQQERSTWKAHANRVFSLTFSPDGTHLLSTGMGPGAVKVWQIPAGRELAHLGGEQVEQGMGYTMDLVHKTTSNTAMVMSSGFTPTGTTALVGLTLWNVMTGDLLRVFQYVQDHNQSLGPPCAVAFSPDGKLAVSGIFNGVVTLWDVESGQNLENIYLSLQRERIWEQTAWQACAVGFSADGRSFVVGTGPGLLLHFELLAVPDASMKIPSAAVDSALPEGRK